VTATLAPNPTPEQLTAARAGPQGAFLIAAGPGTGKTFTMVERFRWLGLIGLLFGFAGVVLIVAPGASLGGADAWKWFLLALLAPVMFAGSNVAAAILCPPASSSVATGAGVMLGSAAVLLHARRAGDDALRLGAALLHLAGHLLQLAKREIGRGSGAALSGMGGLIADRQGGYDFAGVH